MPCPGWPDVDCSGGRTARSFLNEVIARVEASQGSHATEVRDAAVALREREDVPGTCQELCARVYAAHAAAMESPPAWTLVLQALRDEAVPAGAAALTSGPTVVVEGTPSRAPSPARPPRPPAKKKPVKAAAKKKAAKGRPRKPARRVATKRAKTTRKRGTAKPRTPKANASRSRPKKRRRSS
jgi:hypothetical protein